MSKEITLEILNKWQEEGIVFQLIDVRTEEEHLEFNIGGTNIPLDEVMIRSTFAIQRLTAIFPDSNFYNLSKGIKNKSDM